MLQCKCPMAHIIAAPLCTNIGECRGHQHHAASFLESVSWSDKVAAMKIIAVEDKIELANVERIFQCGVERSVCNANCPCVCHLCGDGCHDYAVNLRDEGGSGPLAFIWLRSPHGVIRQPDGSHHLQDLQALVDAMRSGQHPSDKSSLNLRNATQIHPRLGEADSAQVHDDAWTSQLKSIRVSMRVEAGVYVWDTLLVEPANSTASDHKWWALMVDAFPQPLLFVGSASSRMKSMMETYVEYLAFAHDRGRRPYTLASVEELNNANALVDKWQREAQTHPAFKLKNEPKPKERRTREEARSNTTTILKTPRHSVVDARVQQCSWSNIRDIYRLVRDMYHYGREQEIEIHEEIVNAYLARGEVAKNIACEGAPTAGFDVFCEGWYNDKRKVEQYKKRMRQ